MAKSQPRAEVFLKLKTIGMRLIYLYKATDHGPPGYRISNQSARCVLHNTRTDPPTAGETKGGDKGKAIFIIPTAFRGQKRSPNGG